MQNWSFQCASFRMQFGWLTGLALCLAAMAAWAQPPDFGLPSPGGEMPGCPFGGSEGVLGEGDRAAKFEAGFTTPGPDRTAQLFIIATLPPGAHTYSITQPHGGPLATKIKVSPPQGVPTIGAFQSVKPPRIEHDEDAFPGLRLETHTGKVKWVAPSPTCRRGQARDAQDRRQGQRAALRCQGLRSRRIIRLLPTLRADVQAVKVEAH